MNDINILVVDDEKEIADLLELYLISDGYQVKKAYDAMEGLQIMKKEKIDLVLLDIKHSDAKGHKELTGREQSPVLAFAKALEQAEVPMIIRHVAVPGITDQEEELREVGHLIGRFRNLKGLEVLPYHTMGVNKYKELGMEYSLDGVPDMKPEEAKKARNIILEGIREISLE